MCTEFTDEKLNSLAATADNLLQASQATLVEAKANLQSVQMEKLAESQLASDALRGLLLEQTLQLKQMMDYLLSRDEEQPS